MRARLTGLAAMALMTTVACAPTTPPAATQAAAPTAAPQPPVAAAAKPTEAPKPAAAASAAPAPTAAAAAKPAGPLRKVRIGVSGAFLPLASAFIGVHKGYYKEEGIDAEVKITPGLTGAQALLAGDLDFFASSSTDIMLLAGRGENMMAVVTPETNVIISLSLRPDVLEQKNVKPSDPIDKKLAALKGLTIAVSGEGSVTDTTLQLMLKQAKLTPTDIRKVNIDAHPARLAALQNKQIDGYVAGAPLDVQTERSKDATIFISAVEVGDLKDFVFESYYGVKGWIDAHPDETRGLARAIVKGNKFLLNDPTAVQLMRDNEFKSVDEPSLTESLNRMKKGIPADGKMAKAGWDGVMKFAIAGGLLKEPVDTSEGKYWTNKYLD